MIVVYSREGGVSTAISRTFDGKHPCALCCAVQDGRKQEEKKAPALQLELKKDFIVRSFLFEVVCDFISREYGQYYRDLVGITLEPLIPPPESGELRAARGSLAIVCRHCAQTIAGARLRGNPGHLAFRRYCFSPLFNHDAVISRLNNPMF